jgi:hypothetical protein
MYKPATHKRVGKGVKSVCSRFYKNILITVLTETINGVNTDDSYDKQAF